MKKIFKLLISIVILMMPIIVKAESATISVSSANSVIQGNTVTVTVSLSAGESWTMSLDYDSSFLKLISGGGESGGTRMVNTSTGNSSRSYTFKFQALQSGSTTVKVNSYEVVADDMTDMDVTSYGKTISIITQAQLEASYSKNNNLKNIVVDGYEISPKFSTDTLDYSVTVPEDTEKVKVAAYVQDSTASVAGEGELAVELGTNKFNIVVRAQNGSEKTYTLTVNVKDENPINVEVDGEKYTLVKVSKKLEKPSSFTEKTIKISDVEVPAFYNENTKITLVGLKDSDGNVNLYIYDNDTYEKYIEYDFGNLVLYSKELTINVDGYSKTTCKIDDNEVECLKSDTNKRYRLIYGVNVSTNEEGLYLYDTTDNTAVKYDQDQYDKYNEKINMLTYITFGLAGLTFLSLLLLIISSFKKGKKKKVKPNVEEVTIPDEEEVIEEDKVEVVEDNNIEEMDKSEEDDDDSFLTEKEKKKRTKRKK